MGDWGGGGGLVTDHGEIRLVRKQGLGLGEDQGVVQF